MIFLSILMLFLSIPGAEQFSQQERLGDARFRLVRRSLEFLATDERTFSNITQPLCPECRNKKDLISFIRVNQLEGAESRLHQWLIIPDNELTLNSLAELKSNIIGDLTSGPGRDSRKELESYRIYVEDMDIIVKTTGHTSPSREDNVPDDTYPIPPVYIHTFLILSAMAIVILLIRLNKALERDKINSNELKKSHLDLKNLQAKLKEQEILNLKSAEELAFLKNQLQLLEQDLKSKKIKSRV